MRNPYLGPTFSSTCSDETQKSLAVLSIFEEFFLSIKNPIVEPKKLKATIEAFCFYLNILGSNDPLSGMYQLLIIIQTNKPLSFAKYKETFKSFFFQLFPFFHKIKNNENFLFYLLEHRTEFNAFLGDNTIEHLLFDLFPEGVLAIRKVLLEKYEKRGFPLMIEKCEQLLQNLR